MEFIVLELPAEYNFFKLWEELKEVDPTVEGSLSAGKLQLQETVLSVPEIQAIVDAHDPALKTADQSLVDSVAVEKAEWLSLAAGVKTLSPKDAIYVMWVRFWALRNGQVEQWAKDNITTRQEAVAYIASTPEWIAAPAETQQLLSIMFRSYIDMMSIILDLAIR